MNILICNVVFTAETVFLYVLACPMNTLAVNASEAQIYLLSVDSEDFIFKVE